MVVLLLLLKMPKPVVVVVAVDSAVPEEAWLKVELAKASRAGRVVLATLPN